MIPDADILEARVQVMRELPWPIPALMLLRFTDEDLDFLDVATGTSEYWGVLNRAVARIERELQDGSTNERSV